jgi:hypothetical protein
VVRRGQHLSAPRENRGWRPISPGFGASVIETSTPEDDLKRFVSRLRERNTGGKRVETKLPNLENLECERRGGRVGGRNLLWFGRTGCVGRKQAASTMDSSKFAECCQTLYKRWEMDKTLGRNCDGLVIVASHRDDEDEEHIGRAFALSAGKKPRLHYRQRCHSGSLWLDTWPIRAWPMPAFSNPERCDISSVPFSFCSTLWRGDAREPTKRTACLAK